MFLKGLIVLFAPVIHVIFGFHPCKIFGLICTLVKKTISEYPPPSSSSPHGYKFNIKQFHGYIKMTYITGVKNTINPNFY